MRYLPPPAGAMLVGAVLLASACGGGATPAADTGSSPSAASTSTPSGSAQQTTGPSSQPAAGGTLTVYSGRSEELVGSVIEDFTAASGIEVEVRYGDTAELAATILNEGASSPADVFWAQDAGALGALQAQGLFAQLPADVVDVVDPEFRSEEDVWVGVTGRARVIAHNTESVGEDEVPASVFELTEPQWEGRVGWAPTNGSFQSFVTAMREIHGEDRTRAWIEGMIANGAQEYPANSPIVEALGRGEIDLGLVNHYYLYRFLAEDPDFPVANSYPDGDVGSLVNAAGVGVLASSEQTDLAEQFVSYLLSEDVQSFFGTVTDELEYPLRDGVDAAELPPLDSLDAPDVDLSDLEDLQGTLELLREAGALP